MTNRERLCADRTFLVLGIQIIIVVISFYTSRLFEIDRNRVFMLFQYQTEVLETGEWEAKVRGWKLISAIVWQLFVLPVGDGRSVQSQANVSGEV
jgi:hypothetical protein